MKKNNLIKLMIIIVIIMVIIIILATYGVQNKENITKINDKIWDISAFTLTDNGTEIDLKIKNNTKKNIHLKKITLKLYDSNNKLIKNINKKINKEIKIKDQILIKIEKDEKYSATANIKCLLYKKINDSFFTKILSLLSLIFSI